MYWEASSTLKALSLLVSGYETLNCVCELYYCMQEDLDTLHRIHEGIGRIETDHNTILDTQAAIRLRIRELDEEVREELVRVRQSLRVLREDVRSRLYKAKKATTLLSLLAQQEELVSVQTRVDTQPYELYATTEWFTLFLNDRFKSRKSDS